MVQKKYREKKLFFFPPHRNFFLLVAANMADEINELDEIRHQHHLRRRSDVDKRLAGLVWAILCAILFARVVQKMLKYQGQKR